MIRITADLDNTPLSVAKMRTIAVIDYVYRHYNITFSDKIFRLSSSKKGCHVILWTDNKLNKEMILLIRYLLGDDTKRLIEDKKRRRPKQYLFRKKVKLR